MIRTAPGLARVAVAELRFRRAISRDTAPAILRQRNHDLIFIQRSGDNPPGATLRIPEEVHACLLYGRYKISNAQLARLAAVLRAQQGAFRLVVTADGAHFPRQDTKRWLSRELQGRGVQLSEETEQIVWAFCIEAAYYVTLLRCSATDAPLRHQRRAERPGSLPPTIAAAMAFLGQPQPRETILDPVCGTGTLLAEAYAYAPDADLIGVDLDRAALCAAQENLAHIAGHRLIPGDGTATGLPPRSVTLFLANLPFGKQFGDRGTNPRLYGGLLAEMVRLAAPGRARAVFLSSDGDAVEDALAAHPGLTVGKRHPIKVRGEAATIFVADLSPTV